MHEAVSGGHTHARAWPFPFLPLRAAPGGARRDACLASSGNGDYGNRQTAWPGETDRTAAIFVGHLNRRGS
jgi:hypothetical protein